MTDRRVVNPDEVRAALAFMVEEERRIPLLFSGDSFELRLRVVATPDGARCLLEDGGSFAITSTHGRTVEAQP